MHEVLVNRLGGLSLPRKSVVGLTDRPDMTLDVYRGRKTTTQQQQQWILFKRTSWANAHADFGFRVAHVSTCRGSNITVPSLEIREKGLQSVCTKAYNRAANYTGQQWKLDAC